MNKRPLFEHRHFKWLASFLNTRSGFTVQQIEALANALCATNENFQPERFIAAASGNPSDWRDKV